jgi:U3 small nucleolar RNA-associated protein 21
VPFTSVPLGKTTFQITTSVGRSLQSYDLRRGLQLVFLSRPQCPEAITATCAYRDRVFVAWGGVAGKDQGVWVVKRGKLIAELERPQVSQQIDSVLVFGTWIVTCGKQAIEVWRNGTYEHYTTIVPTLSSSIGGSFTGKICTLPTYLNKIFVGCSNGNVEIYNLSTAKLVHTIHAPSASAGHVTALAPAMALSVLAVAYRDGSLKIYNVDTEDTIISISARARKPITAITFRSDGVGAGADGRKDGVMATASIESGDITLWDLNSGGRVTGVLHGAHETSALSKASGISGLEFLPGQQVLVSSGLDNALRSWVFDAVPFSPTPRLLHQRSGHAAPVTELMFLPAASDGSEAAGKWLLSAGQDRSLWGFSLRKDGQNTELSQGNVKSKAKKTGHLSEDRSAIEDFKANPIIDVACSLNRDGGMGAVTGSPWSNERKTTAEESSMTGWESVVTAHADDRYARTWSWGRKKAGRWTFESGDKQPVTSVAITQCGTFALVGSAKGALDMYNLQSGVHRQRFPARLKPSQAKEIQGNPDVADTMLAVRRGHRAAVTGIVVDSLNQTVVSAALDGTIIFWSFTTGLVEHRLNLPDASALTLRYSPSSSLLALSCDDLCIRILDVESRRVVRELWGCIGPINSLTFSHDGRWVIASSMDSVVRVFDLATGHLIDAFRLSPTCTNVAFNSTGEYLATTHAGTLGIQIWANKSLFSHINPQPISEESGIIDLTSTASTLAPLSAFAMIDTEGTTQQIDGPLSSASTTDQLSTSLLTLSLLPRSRWTTLLNLDTIRQRNKPIAPPEKPKAAPFFLGSALALTNGTSKTIDSTGPINNDISRITAPQSSALTTANSAASETGLLALLDVPLDGSVTAASSTRPSPNVHPLLPQLLVLPPSATSTFLRTLPLSKLPTFITILNAHLRTTRRDFEVINTYISLLLKYHAEFVAVDDVAEALEEYQRVNEEEGQRLGELVGFAGGVLRGWLGSAR